MAGSPVRGGLFVVSAPSGGGKTSLTRALVPRLAERGIPAAISVSYTTRPPRPGEHDGVHYHFVDEVQFEQMVHKGEFLEHAHVFGRRYGTGRRKTDELLAAGHDVILDIDWQGGRQVRSLAPDTLGIFILPPSLEELERRLRGRGQDGDEAIARRMAQAREEMSHYAEYDYLLVNRDFERALAELEAPFLARRLRLSVQQAAHKSLIDSLLAPRPPLL
ncbi:MAG: guanylate kinase [Gammaproteobacteria bacterium]|nr:guanylate kinase [Gammaproteobacteria bacterium]